jgi:hypothetical protein
MPQNIHAKAVGQRNILQKIGNLIPGFRGYQKKEERREVDQIQRDWCAAKLSESKDPIKQALDDVICSGDLDNLMPYEKLLNRLDTVASLIRNADRGYSGMFDTIKIGDDQLAKVYEFDLSLVEGVNEVTGKIRTLTGSDKAKDLATIKEATNIVNKVEEYFGRREDILRKG